jgi:sugar fermentation stimulation protein A
MEGMKWVEPNDSTHPEFGAALRRAAASGVEILALECRVTPDSLTGQKYIPVKY